MTHNYKATLDAFNYVDNNFMNIDGLSEINKNTIRAALKLAIALQPKPISEAEDGQEILTPMKHGIISGHYRKKDNEVSGYYWRDMTWLATHFYDISALPKPEGD